MKPESSGDPLNDLIIRGIGRLMPVPYADVVTDEQYQVLKRRNRLVSGVADALCVLAAIGGVFLPIAIRGRPVHFTGWDIGVQFGLAVGLPVAWIMVAAPRIGHGLREFLVFYSLRYGVDARKLFLFVYLPFIVLGLVSVYFAYFQSRA